MSIGGLAHIALMWRTLGGSNSQDGGSEVRLEIGKYRLLAHKKAQQYLVK